MPTNGMPTPGMSTEQERATMKVKAKHDSRLLQWKHVIQNWRLHVWALSSVGLSVSSSLI